LKIFEDTGPSSAIEELIPMGISQKDLLIKKKQNPKLKIQKGTK